MPLAKGPNSIRRNVNELMKGVESSSRHKAIMTIAKKHNISYDDAMFQQAQRIAQSQARKK